MYKILKPIITWLEDLVCVMLLFVMFATILVQIYFRYFLANPLTWTEELSRFVFIWMSFLGSAVAMRDNSHISLDILLERLPAPVSKWLKVVFNVLILLFCFVVIPKGLRYVVFMNTVPSAALQWPQGLFMLSVPVACCLIVFHAIENICKLVKLNGQGRESC